MRYDYRCPDCDFEEEKNHSIKESPLFLCPECKVPMERKIGAGAHTILLRGSFPSKDLKEKNYRKKRSQEMDRKMRLSHESPSVVPNVDGERVDSWGDAKKLAADKGYDPSTYDRAAEKGTTNPDPPPLERRHF